MDNIHHGIDWNHPNLIFNGMETVYSLMTMPVEVSDIELPSIMMAENDLCVCLKQNGPVAESQCLGFDIYLNLVLHLKALVNVYM